MSGSPIIRLRGQCLYGRLATSLFWTIWRFGYENQDIPFVIYPLIFITSRHKRGFFYDLLKHKTKLSGAFYEAVI